MAEPTATGLVHNLDTDPNCLKQRESWRSNVTKPMTGITGTRSRTDSRTSACDPP